MSRAKQKPASAPNKPPKGWWVGAAITLVIAVAIVASLNSQGTKPSTKPGLDLPNPVFTTIASTNPGTSAPPAVATPATNVDAVPVMEAAQSVVVTQDLDFGPARPTLTEALAQIDRRSQPEDGKGRTFSILEAFNGEFQPDGRMRVSLRISTEKPGVAQVVFRPTGQELWKCRIKPASHKPGFDPTQLTILFDNGDGKTFRVDGSTGPASIFDAKLQETGMPVAQAWPDGDERELAFVYSACGCPIKVHCLRVGNRTQRTQAASQVIFPDDPFPVQLISRLMAW